MASVYARLVLIAIVFFHSLVFLSSYWSARLKARIRYFSAGTNLDIHTIRKYPFVKAYHKKKQTSYCEIVPIQKYYDNTSSDNEGYFLRFRESKFIYDEKAKAF